MLNPEEIASREFLVALRGFDRDEVTTFLEDVAGDVDKLQRQVRDLEGKLSEARSGGDGAPSVPSDPRDAFKALGEETTRILVAAEESATEIREKADTEARNTIESAQKRAREELDGAQKRAKEELDSARRQAREDVEEARRSANRIVTEAEAQRDGIADEIRSLEAARDRLVGDLRTALSAVHESVGDLTGDAEATGTAPEGEDEAGEDDEAGDDDAEIARAAAEASADIATSSEPSLGDTLVADREHIEPAEAAPAGDENAAVTLAVARTPDAEPDAEVDQVAAATDRGTDSEEWAATATMEHDAFELREQSLSGVRPGMLRRLKRALQDVQNGALDSLRRADDDPDLDGLLPADDDLATVGAVGQMFLTAAYRAGLSDAATLADGTLDEDAGDATRIPAAASSFRDALTHEITSSLRATLRAGIDAGEPETSLSERIGEVFRDLKGPVVEGVVEEHLTRIYSDGAEDAWLELGVEETVWLVGDEPRCPENRCRTNANEGPVELGEDYPSGHRVPPAHSGCTCVLVPAPR